MMGLLTDQPRPEATCLHCGAPARPATRIAMHAMHDSHCFVRYYASNVDELIGLWRRDLLHGEPLALCPIIVLSGDRELRRVGKMVHYGFRGRGPDEEAINAFRAAILADPDISRIMAADALIKAESEESAA